MSQYIIGLTGGIGSGKTTIANIFAKLGVDIVDADIVAREAVAVGSDALKAIEHYFGSSILLENGALNRGLLRQKIFSNEQDKTWLNNLLHPLIRQLILTQLAHCKSPYCILVAPLLLENNLHSVVNRVLVIDVDEETQITRTCQRDNNSPEQIQKMIASQISREQRLMKADDVIDNQHSSSDDIQKQVKKLNRDYLAYARAC